MAMKWSKSIHGRSAVRMRRCPGYKGHPRQQLAPVTQLQWYHPLAKWICTACSAENDKNAASASLYK